MMTTAEGFQQLRVPISRKLIPQASTRFPYIYLDRARIHVDGSSVKAILAEGEVLRIPVSSLLAVFLGPGTSITHEAVCVCAASNCTLCWMTDGAFRFQAVGQSPTHDSKNFRRQLQAASKPESALVVARRLMKLRFPNDDFTSFSIKDILGTEGGRIKALYAKYADLYHVGWKGRHYTPGNFHLSDSTNQYLTLFNSFLYGILSAVVHSLGYSPYIGFIHSGSPLPFIYDLADLYKADASIEVAFRTTLETSGQFDSSLGRENFRLAISRMKLIDRSVKDLKKLFKGFK